MITHIILMALSTNLTLPTEYEVGSGQEPEPMLKDFVLITTESPENDTSIKSKKHTKKHYKKGKKHFAKTSNFELNSFMEPNQQNTGSIVAASLGGLFIVTGFILMVKNYCKKRSGYQHINPMQNQGVGYGTLDNVYEGH